MPYSDPRSVCDSWITGAELCCEGGVEVDDCDPLTPPVPLVFPWTDDQLALAASNILYGRTCYKFPGQCERTVWPCIDCHCHCHPCACGTWSVLKLPTSYPVLSIEEVRIDGVPMNPLDYRLDMYKWLVRMDGEHWPACNSFGLPNTNSVEIQVDVTVGREPPIELKMAAADLACELKKACNADDTCALPPHVRAIARRGVSIEIDDITSLFKDGLFGIPSVDMAIKIHGNCSYSGSLFDPAKRHFHGYEVSP